jgi:23S rRNA (cytosine1962-C5)-methyltransferase
VIGANRNSHDEGLYYEGFMNPTVTISPRGEDRLRSGHPWIYRADVTNASASAGDRVVVQSTRGQILGSAFYSSRSQITLRILTRGEAPADDALVRKRIEAALAFRKSLAIDATAYRMIHGEADLLPSIVVDRYGDYLVVQTLSQGADKLLPLVVSVLQDVAQPKGILARNDPRTRSLEGLEQKVEVVAGDVPEAIAVTENGVCYDVDVRRGQKTGLFLDQRENRAAAALYAHGRALDCFTYNGGFALALAPKCREVLAFDVSEDAIARTKDNAAKNGVTVDARVGNVFDELRGLDRLGERFDTIVLDPPAFAKNKAAVANARTGYKEINLRALKLLNPGGILVTCSCSYNINEGMFAEIVYEASVDAMVNVTVVEKRMQGRDHPVLLGVPETYYLKCFVLRKL